MGYSARGNGDATFKDDVDLKEIEKKLDELLGTTNGHRCWADMEFEISEESDGHKWIRFWESDSCWHEEDTMEFLNALNPYIVGGQADYSGEDDSIWRYVYDAEEETWTEEDATICYGFEAFSDNELIEELKKRGYRVEAA